MAGYKLQGKTLEGNMVDIPLVATYDSDGNNIAESFKKVEDIIADFGSNSNGEVCYYEVKLTDTLTEIVSAIGENCKNITYLFPVKFDISKLEGDFFSLPDDFTNFDCGGVWSITFNSSVESTAEYSSYSRTMTLSDNAGNFWVGWINSKVEPFNGWSKIDNRNNVNYYLVKPTDTQDDLNRVIGRDWKNVTYLFPSGYDMSNSIFPMPDDYTDSSQGSILSITINNSKKDDKWIYACTMLLSDNQGNIWHGFSNMNDFGWTKVGAGSGDASGLQFYKATQSSTYIDITAALKETTRQMIVLFPVGYDVTKLSYGSTLTMPSDFTNSDHGLNLSITFYVTDATESPSGEPVYTELLHLSDNYKSQWYGYVDPDGNCNWMRIATSDRLSTGATANILTFSNTIVIPVDLTNGAGSYILGKSDEYVQTMIGISANVDGVRYSGQGMMPVSFYANFQQMTILLTSSTSDNDNYYVAKVSQSNGLYTSIKVAIFNKDGSLATNITQVETHNKSLKEKSLAITDGKSSIYVDEELQSEISFDKDPQSQINECKEDIKNLNVHTHIITNQFSKWLDNLPNEPGVDTYIFTAGDYYTNDNNFWMETSGEINHNPFILKITTIEPGDSWKTGRRIWEFTSMNYESDGQRYIWSQHDLNSIGDASISWKGGKPNWQKVATIDGSYASANISRLVKSMNDIDLGKDPYSTVSLILLPGVTVFDNSLIPYLPEDYDTTVCGVLTANAITFMFSLTDANKNRWEGYLDEKTNTITWNKLASASEITNLKNELDSIKHNKTQIKSRTYELTMSASSNDANVWFYCDDVNIDNAIGCEIEFTTQDKTRGFKGTAGVPDFSGSSVSSFDNVLGTFVGVELNNNNNFTWWSTVGTCTTTLDGATHRALNIRSVKAHCKTLTNNDSEYRDYTGITNGRCKLTILYCE